MKKITFMFFAFLSITIGFAQTETLAGWSFPTDDGTPVVIAAECGSGNLYADGTNGSGDWTGGVDFFGGHTPTTDNQVCGATANTQAYSLLNGASGANNGKHLVFKFSTADYEDIVLTYSTRGTANGFDTHTWAYSTDGVNFTDASTITGTNNTTFSTKTVDFSLNTAINNQSDVYIRLTLSGAGTQNSQNNRLDNVKFVGTEVETGSPSGYCIPTATTNSSTQGIITNVTFNDINNSTTDNDDAYQDYTSISTTVVPGSSHILSVTTEAGGMMFTTWSKAWIDWNNDNVFDATEEYDFGSGTFFSTTIQIPANTLGEYRLRVRTYSQNAMLPSGFVIPCDNLNSSEAEDYTIIVEEESDPCTETITPVFTQVNSICAGDDLPALPTISDNEITGTWYPALDNTQTTTYTFTPDPDQCAEEVQMTIVVNPTTTPEFMQVSEICAGDDLSALPTISVNGITGTWYPALNNMETTTYEFTPSPGQCAASVTMTITVNPLDVPVFMQVAPICAGDDLVLPTSTNGIYGVWTPAPNNQETTTYEFTPNPGQCAASVSMTIEVNVATAPTVESPQTLVAIIQTVEDIVATDVTGTITWYDADGNIIDAFTVLTEGTYTFYVTQTIGDCESEAVEVEVVVTSEVSTNTFDNTSFRAYPNPVKDFFMVSYNKEITNVTVVNMLGQTLMTKSVNATDTQIDMTSLPTGNYFVKVTTEGAVKKVKVVKQ